ncbi:MAG: haloacid dehalogenase-like hydrolase [Erysipelotrichaceae bacterium]|nr:haloacid dehalogenase-like hydrolase [Erysipelotrichaceae bacterium]
MIYVTMMMVIDMNVYDFDKTIYYDDSTVDFVLYCMRKYPKTWLYLPQMIWGGVGYGLRLISKTKAKEWMYSFLKGVPQIEDTLEQFWDQYQHKIKSWYLQQQQESDVVISASPEFLLQPICKRLGIRYLLASQVDAKTGKTTGENCWGQEKVRRFQKVDYYGEIDEFYSDSYSDDPLAQLAKKSYLVDGDRRLPW